MCLSVFVVVRFAGSFQSVFFSCCAVMCCNQTTEPQQTSKTHRCGSFRRHADSSLGHALSWSLHLLPVENKNEVRTITQCPQSVGSIRKGF